MKRFLLALALTAVGVVAIVTYRTPSESAGTAEAAGASTTGTGVSGVSADGVDSGQSVSGAGASGRNVTGPAVKSFFGPVQVQLTMSNGRITRARAVVFPHRGHSLEVNSRAVPMLDRGVLQAQSAMIDTVSGATYTSKAYKKSLQAALDGARA